MCHWVTLLLAFQTIGNGETNRFKPADGGGAASPPSSACLDDRARARIWRRLDRSRAALGTKGDGPAPRFILPVVQDPRFNDISFWAITNFVDHDPAFPNQLADFEGGQRTYDTSGGYNHAGSDFFLWPFGWEMMDRDQVWAVAAAAGVIIGKDDGNFDRNCTLPPPNPSWNAVYIEHADGSTAWYGHLKNGSLTAKAVGESVAAGEFLGVIGSSGVSTGPHLHFEIYDAANNLNDPYAGPFNAMNAASWWLSQPGYFEPLIVRLMTHDGAPSIQSFCPEDEIINRADAFLPGERMHTSVFYRDQQQGQVTNLSLMRPDGSLFANWTHQIQEPHLAASFWQWHWDLPLDAPHGTWSFRAVFEGQTVTHRFVVGPCPDLFWNAAADWPDGASVLDLLHLTPCFLAGQP